MSATSPPAAEVGYKQGCQTPFEKKAKPCLKRAKPGEKAKMLNNMKFKNFY